MQTLKAVLNRTSRILAGHLWVFSNELLNSPRRFPPGSLVEVEDRKGRFLGIGYSNPASLISIRILTREREEIGEDFFRKRILAALEYRKRFLEGRESFRAVYSESDLLPGLIVDKFGDCLSVQYHTLGIEGFSDVILKVLDEVFSPGAIVLKNDSSIRALEGLPLEKRLVKGTLDPLPRMKEGETALEVDPFSGQKTGFFLDQADNRTALSRLVKGGEGLDLFCYSGAWSVRLASAGASVTGVDSSEAAITLARRNADINGLGKRCSFVKSDVFDYLKEARSSGKRYDFMVVDPPAFVKSKAKIKEGLRAYRDLNASAFSLVKKGGVIAASSCSYHVDRAAFLDTLRDAARDAGKEARIIEIRSQARDHPISLSVPETEYLKCVILEVF